MSHAASGYGPDPVRFEALVIPHLDSLFAFARRRAATEADGEDLVQEMCVRAWRSFDDLRDDGRVRAWLFCILRRLLSDHHRTESHQRATVSLTRLEAIHEELIASPDPGPFEALLSRLSRERVWGALERIPEDFRTVVELHDIDGLRYREIAQILELPLGTVMSRMHRGRKLLAGWIAADGAAEAVRL